MGRWDKQKLTVSNSNNNNSNNNNNNDNDDNYNVNNTVKKDFINAAHDKNNSTWSTKNITKMELYTKEL